MIAMAGVQVEQEDAVSPKPPTDDRLVVKWLETQPESCQKQLALERLGVLLDNAAQPRHASGNACIKLCYFIEQCKSSKYPKLRELAFSEKTSLDLFNFFIDWNEKNQHRSMRQVLELLISLISLNPDQFSSDIVLKTILKRLVSIITHQSAQPLVKPAFKSLECFLGKGTISTGALIDCYADHVSAIRPGLDENSQRELLWDSFMSEVFEWLTLPDVSPASGKFLVTLFVQLRNESARSHIHTANHTVLWQRWIRNGLNRNPEMLENVKNYLFPPLFKLDRSGSIVFLSDLNSQGPISDLQIQESNAHSLLQLAAIEVGKKSGLVEDPGTFQSQKEPKKATKCVILQEHAIGDLLTNALDTVRSLAFSVLVSSSSTIRPFSAVTLRLLQAHMGVLYADTDAKFRNEILSNTKHMIERLRGAITFLTRELDNVKQLVGLNASNGSPPRESDQELLDKTNGLLKMHEGFILWYLKFLSGEMIPTASYQRHITALKALTLLLRSGILEPDLSCLDPKVSRTATPWPFTIQIFTTGTIRLLLDLVMDSFEDVRASAAVVLKFASRDDFQVMPATDNLKVLNRSLSEVGLGDKQAITRRISQSQDRSNSSSLVALEGHAIANPQMLLTFIDRAQDAARRTGRADYADGVARCYEVLYCLNSAMDARLKLIEGLVEQLRPKLEIAENNLSRAVSEAPVHGDFAALNFVWDVVDPSTVLEGCSSSQLDKERWNSLQFRMLEFCQRIWNAVRDVLCNDSPEGHLPLDIDDVHSIDTKDVLSYSFRAIHESSNLMRNLVSKIKLKWEDGSPVLPATVFSCIGDLTFEQLSTLRHRGAFSTVSLTFARCSQLTQHFVGPLVSHQSLLEKWYQGALQCISEQASTTRRSAGIPAIITGILSSNAETPAFDHVMEELKVLARKPARLTKFDETNFPQVHAMNCLKEIFKSSLLGKRSESHIAECLQIAADSLNSEIWAIRNCGLLLLRSLIDALFGTNESKASTEAGWDGRSIKISYDKYPTLPALLLKLLNADLLENSSALMINSVESMFPALDIVRRAGPPSIHANAIFKSVSNHLESKVWHVREIAARTICTLLLHSDWLPAVVELIESSTKSANRLHGVLMAVKFVLDRRLVLTPEVATDGLAQLALLLKTLKMRSYFESGCPEILAAYLEVSNTIAKILIYSRSLDASSTQSDLAAVKDNLFVHDAYEEFLDLMKTYPTLTASIAGSECCVKSALAFNAVARRSVFTSALRGDTLGLQNVVSFAAALDTDVALAAIEAMSDTWASHNSADTLFGLIKTYMGAIEMTQSPEVRAVAIINLAEVVDQLFGRIDSKSAELTQNSGPIKTPQHPSLDVNEMIRSAIGSLGFLLQDGIKNNSLSNAEIRISGSLFVCEYVSQKHLNQVLDTYTSRMEAWGKLLVRAGNASNEFEIRYAAAAALKSFYNNPYLELYIPIDECVLPSLFALYDTLNDDDDEIRDIGAETVSALLKKSLVPLSARVELAEYMGKLHARARSFAWNVVCRMTGSKLETVDNVRFRLQPVGYQLLETMKDDDALFVEEEQNLFIDEVREAKLWSKAFDDMALNPWIWERADVDIENAWSQPCAAIAAWVTEGLLTSCSLLADEDGPLGWTSKPAVFAIVTRLLVSANAVIQRHEGLVTSAGRSVPGNRTVGGIIFALQQLVNLGKDKNLHQSLLLEAQGKPSLPLANLPRAILDVAKLIKENGLFTSATLPRS